MTDKDREFYNECMECRSTSWGTIDYDDFEGFFRIINKRYDEQLLEFLQNAVQDEDAKKTMEIIRMNINELKGGKKMTNEEMIEHIIEKMKHDAQDLDITINTDTLRFGLEWLADLKDEQAAKLFCSMCLVDLLCEINKNKCGRLQAFKKD